MLVGELRGRVPLFRLTRWQLCAAFVMTGGVSLLTGGWRGVQPWQFGLLALSSVFGIMIASTTYFAAIYSAGPRITALLFSLTSPFALALGYLFLGETLGAWQAMGVVLVLAGIMLAVGLRRGAGAAVSPAGIALGVVTALGQALGTLFARPAMAAGMEPFTAMAIRSGLAALFFVALLAFPFARGSQGPATSRDLGTAVAASFFGTCLGMSCLMAALARGHVGIVATLASTTPVAILPMVWAREGLRPSPTAWVGAALAVAGTALISLNR